MLNRLLLMQELHKKSDKLFVRLENHAAKAYQLWQQLIHDDTFLKSISSVVSSFALPSWHASLDARVAVTLPMYKYSLTALDGSQIYPDRHQGTACFLINIGKVSFDYTQGSFTAHTFPYVFTPYDYEEWGYATELVDCVRHDYEWAMVLEGEKHAVLPTMFLLDGSLIPHYLPVAHDTIKQFFWRRYCMFMDSMAERQVPIAWYMSAPRHKEVMRLLYAYVGGGNLQHKQLYKKFEFITDAMLFQYILAPYERSTVFVTHDALVQELSSEHAVCFFYMNVESEIVRIEVPLYIACNTQQLDMICALIRDQVRKGDGYPIGLAEAHEQAVVDTHDRTFFYAMLDLLGIQRQTPLKASAKSMRKHMTFV